MYNCVWDDTGGVDGKGDFVCIKGCLLGEKRKKRKLAELEAEWEAATAAQEAEDSAAIAAAVKWAAEARPRPTSAAEAEAAEAEAAEAEAVEAEWAQEREGQE